MPEKLKLCPFCGGDAKVICNYEVRPYLFAIACSNPVCDVSAGTMDEASAEQAAKCWNTRPREYALQKRIDELEAAARTEDVICGGHIGPQE